MKLPRTLLGLRNAFPHRRVLDFRLASNEFRLRKFSSFPSVGSQFARLALPNSSRSYTAISPPRAKVIRFVEPRFFSANGAQFAAPTVPLPILSPPSVGRWLLISSAFVFAVIVVGGVTRLTESGLSITEWRPITGILPPLSNAEWNEEFEKYKTTPEFKL